MKTIPSLLARFTLIAVAQISVLNGEPIELVDIEGRKVVAEIVSQQGDKVLLRKDDGKEYLFPITRLTKETRDLMAEKIFEFSILLKPSHPNTSDFLFLTKSILN